MGCFGSKEDTSKPSRNKVSTSVNLNILVFGMPDSGQNSFITQMRRIYSQVGNFSPVNYYFNPIDTSREKRGDWIKEYSAKENVIMSFFFADLSTNGSVLLSIKTYNWLRSQIDEQIPLKIVVLVKNPKDMNSFSFLQENMGPGIEALTFSDSQQSDLQKFSDIISAGAQSLNTKLDTKAPATL